MMMSVGCCTQRKPRTLRASLFGCLFPSFWSPVLFETVDGSTEAPCCNSPKERGDCKNSQAYCSPSLQNLISSFCNSWGFLGFLRRLGQKPSGVPQRPILVLFFFFCTLLVSASWSHLTFTWIIKHRLCCSHMDSGVLDDRWQRFHRIFSFLFKPNFGKLSSGSQFQKFPFHLQAYEKRKSPPS